MITFFDEIFKHPALATAFSGFGIIILSFIGNLIRKAVIKRTQSLNSPKNTKRSISTTIQLQNDIHEIETAIRCNSSSYSKKQIFIRFFNKYKSKLSEDDVVTLQRMSAQSCPNYTDLLSTLLGLLEAL